MKQARLSASTQAGPLALPVVHLSLYAAAEPNTGLYHWRIALELMAAVDTSLPVDVKSTLDATSLTCLKMLVCPPRLSWV